MNFNQFNAVGNVTKDPVVKEIGGKSKVATFRLAMNRPYKKGDEWVEDTTFIDCEAWNQKADYVMSRLKTGTKVLVTGRLEMDEWEKNGERRSKHKIYVLNLQADREPKGGSSSEDESYGGPELPF